MNPFQAVIPSPSPVHGPSSTSSFCFFSFGARGQDGTDLLHRAAFNAAFGGVEPGSPEEQTLSLSSSQLSAALPLPTWASVPGSSRIPTPFTHHAFHRGTQPCRRDLMDQLRACTQLKELGVKVCWSRQGRLHSVRWSCCPSGSPMGREEASGCGPSPSCGERWQPLHPLLPLGFPTSYFSQNFP